ncbi:MAG: CPBP family intramembrane glutamic endopeptidase [Acidobacteriota bacterium]
MDEVIWQVGVRWLIPIVPAIALGWWVIRQWVRHRRPPGLEDPLRRGLAMTLLALFFYVGPLGSIALLGMPLPEPPEESWMLFSFQFFTVVSLALVIWTAYGSSPVPWRRLREDLGWQASRPLEEVSVGVLWGGLAWFGTLLVLAGVALTIQALWGDGILPETPPQLVTAMAAQPFAVRVGLALSAGVVEETFFRGFLQPRIGIFLSTLLFTLGHLAYGSPMLVLGVVLLSLVFAGLMHWRGNVLAAVVAHSVFDGIQLLWLLPAAQDAALAGG